MDSMTSATECYETLDAFVGRLASLDLTLGLLFQFQGHPVPQVKPIESDSDEVEIVEEVPQPAKRAREIRLPSIE
jgi:hypothetical protein